MTEYTEVEDNHEKKQESLSSKNEEEIKVIIDPHDTKMEKMQTSWKS